MKFLNPAAAFDFKAREYLRKHHGLHPDSKRSGGEVDPSSSSAVCRILGVHRAQWTDWTKGNKSPTTTTIQKWMQKWKDAGHPELSITIGIDYAVPKLEKAEA